jgi:hypothetical protein
MWGTWKDEATKSGVGVKSIGVRVAVAAVIAVALAGCDKSTILVSVVNGCGESAKLLVSDATHHDDHEEKNFRTVEASASAVFVVPVGPEGDISLMTWDAVGAKQVTRIVSLLREAADGTSEDGKALRVVTLSGSDCPATG